MHKNNRNFGESKELICPRIIINISSNAKINKPFRKKIHILNLYLIEMFLIIFCGQISELFLLKQLFSKIKNPK